jgi:anaerobic magnesium-protoporphyrin IX monomethyl ester cyclase
MVYNGAFSRSNEEKLIEEVRSLHSRFGATNFVFHDEALPPGLLRRFANRLPPATETGFAFSGLIKFEPAFSASDFDAAARAGFRSLYIGLESASERLLEKMLKPTPRHIMLRNLGDARSAGIWTHCFLFFGFPGETDADASETTEFVLTRTDLISSFGCGTFMLEHGAPILARTQETQFRVWSDRGSRYSLYYNYETVSGPSREVALRRSVELKRRAKDVDWYRATWWVPRDQQLNILARMGGEDLVQASALLQTRSSLFKLYRDGRGWAIAADRSGGVAVVDKLTGAARYFQAGDVKGLPVPYGPLTSAEASRLLLYLMGDDWTANTLEKKALDVASAGERGC